MNTKLNVLYKYRNLNLLPNIHSFIPFQPVIFFFDFAWINAKISFSLLFFCLLHCLILISLTVHAFFILMFCIFLLICSFTCTLTLLVSWRLCGCYQYACCYVFKGQTRSIEKRHQSNLQNKGPWSAEVATRMCVCTCKSTSQLQFSFMFLRSS